MKFAFTFIFPLLCVGLGVDGQHIEKKLEVWHKTGNQEDYVKRGEIVYTFKPQTIKYIGDANPLQFKPSEKDLYTVKVNSLEDDAKVVTSSSAKWCMLESSQFNDQFTIHIDKEGNFFHADYHPGAHDCQDKTQVSEVEFNTTVNLVKPYYETRPRLQRITQEELKEKENAEYSNFFTKYWYVILPVVLLLLVGGGDPPKEGEGNGGR